MLTKIIKGLVWLEKEVIPFGRFLTDGIVHLWKEFLFLIGK